MGKNIIFNNIEYMKNYYILILQVEDFKKVHPTNIEESDDDTYIKTINSETQNI